MSDNQTTELAGGYTAERNKHGTAILHANGGVHIASVCEEALIAEVDRLRAQVAELQPDAEALRLMVAHEMDVFVRSGRWTEAVAPMQRPAKAFHDGSGLAATRLAISMISAAIDRARKSGDGGQG